MMKGLSKKRCGHGVSVNQSSDVCYLYIVCDFLFYGYHCSKKETMALQCPESYGIRPTNDRHTSQCILQVRNAHLKNFSSYQRTCTYCVSLCAQYILSHDLVQIIPFLMDWAGFLSTTFVFLVTLKTQFHYRHIKPSTLFLPFVQKLCHTSLNSIMFSEFYAILILN